MSYRVYYPKHEENRMKNEGDVLTARKSFIKMFTEQNRTEHQNYVLYELLRSRFDWMNGYIYPDDENIIEVGCGAGLSKFFITNPRLVLTDVLDNSWVDRYEDAMNLSCADNSLDVVIASEMIHHLASPYAFFKQLEGKLKPGGRIIIQDMHNSLIMKLVLRIMRHEGWDDNVNVYDKTAVCNQSDDPWSANCSITMLLFDNKALFEKTFPDLEIIKDTKMECFMFLFSGGVIAKGPRLPLSKSLTKLLSVVDKCCIKMLPGIFACGRSIVIRKR